MDNKAKGFTLVEMLIAVSILLMVLFIGSYAYKQYSQYWHKELGEFDTRLKQAKSLSMLYNIIHNIRPHMIKDGELWFHYFEGGNTLIRSVTAEAVSEPEFPAYFELSVENDEEDALHLVYREKAISKEPLLALSQINEYDYEVHIPLTFERVLLEYKGWKHVDEYFSLQSDSGIKPKETWFGFYSGQDTLVTPSIVKITLVTEQGDSELLIPLPAFVPEYVQFYGKGND